MKKLFLQKNILAMLLLLVAVSAYSQGGPPPPPPPPPPPASVPIDGAVFLLLGAGLVYGGRKLYNE